MGSENTYKMAVRWSCWCTNLSQGTPSSTILCADRSVWLIAFVRYLTPITPWYTVNHWWKGQEKCLIFLKSTRVSDWVIRGRRREATPARDVALMLAVQWQAVCTLRVRSDKTENPCPGLACFLIDSTIGDQMRMDISQIFVYIFIERND